VGGEVKRRGWLSPGAVLAPHSFCKGGKGDSPAWQAQDQNQGVEGFRGRAHGLSVMFNVQPPAHPPPPSHSILPIGPPICTQLSFPQTLTTSDAALKTLILVYLDHGCKQDEDLFVFLLRKFFCFCLQVYLYFYGICEQVPT
jgi:hypothetical protein